MSPNAAPKAGAYKLSEMGQDWLHVKCVRCNREGFHRADRLLAEFGDRYIPDAMQRIAARGKCARALNPPPVGSMSYNDERCQITSVVEAPTKDPTLHEALHGRWRGLLTCERHHQGLKAARPCLGVISLDVPSLVAAMGHGMELADVPGRICCPGCGSKALSVRWVKPDGSVAA